MAEEAIDQTQVAIDYREKPARLSVRFPTFAAEKVLLRKPLALDKSALNPQSASEANTTYAITTTLRMIVAIAATSTMSKAGLANVRSLVAVERQR